MMTKLTSITLLLTFLFGISWNQSSCANNKKSANALLWNAEKIDTVGANFSYRTVYSFGNRYKDFSENMGLGNLNYDWGLWGHNMRKVLPEEPAKEVFARINGERDDEQFCFSSSKLLEYTANYIKENYDGKEHVRFVIMPNDGLCACTCSLCRAKGNTGKNATPAVTDFIKKLARRFPNHQFFTTYYLSTATMPTQALPENVGVIVSAINLPLMRGVEASLQGVAFADLLEQWRQKTKHVYVWDYCRNFDDYLTPFPCLHILQQRLLMYKRHGVEGIIFNGSGDDYSTFDIMQTWVLAKLMVDATQDVNHIVNQFLSFYYPKTGKKIEKYYRSLEDAAMRLELYEGIGYATKSYLDREQFVHFVDELEASSKKASAPERTRLNYLLTGLNFTRLELMRLTNDVHLTSEKGNYIANLRGHSELAGMTNYREANGDLDEYIDYVAHHKAREVAANNLMWNTKLASDSELDEGALPLDALTDGFMGIPMDYHTSWMFFSGERLHLTLPAKNVAPDTLRVGMLISLPWHIGKARVIARQGDKQVAVNPKIDANKKNERLDVALDVSGMDGTKPIELYLEKTGRKIAIDEIQLLSK